MIRVFLLMLTFVFSLVNANEISPFTTDGCSLFPNGTIKQNKLWLSCCTAHDYAYWQGGTFDERLIADLKLEQCVAEVGEPNIAILMLAGVRVGGTPYLPNSFRWGYGWHYFRGYQALTRLEKQKIQSMKKSILYFTTE